MKDVFVIGIGMTRFARHLDRSIKSLAKEALDKTLADASIGKEKIEAIYFSNSNWGYQSDQHCIRGQVALRPEGMMGIPIYNLENACAGGATAFHSAWLGVASGLYECVLALGAEKMYEEDKVKMFRAFWTAIDIENMEAHMKALQDVSRNIKLNMPVDDEGEGAGRNRSAFMDVYSAFTRYHMNRYGTTQHHLAVIASKNHYHGSMNPNAQFQKEMRVEEILAARPVSWPLTVPMCAPVGDGGAAAVLCSAEFLKKLNFPRPVRIRASVLGSGTDRAIEEDARDIACRVSLKAYEMAGVGPEDIDVAEVHDATAYGELHQSEALGFCPIGDGGPFAESGATKLGGKIPINISGGLESRGHPIGASGLGQIHELVTQLRHEAGPRQVEGCKLALAENGGGNLSFEEAAMGIHILERVRSS
ncbi:MAG: thiolase family protein [Deltaproteobacteria bacterium]|nr:thiolase family protein [Deltaproteobacteria bacterium]